MSGFSSSSSSIRIVLFAILSFSFIISANSKTVCNGITCTSVSGATINPTCNSDQTCGYTCGNGKDNCDNNWSNGCEVVLNTNVGNCGTCGNNCTAAPGVKSATCTAGLCHLTCSTSYGNCDNNTSTGCEVFFPTDPNHCGSCNNDCFGQPNVADATCSGGKCVISQCDPGFSDCFPAVAGCETATTNCSCLPSACPVAPNAERSCQTGECTGVCANGWGDCNFDTTAHLSVGSDGCETSLLYSADNCGACGNNCSTLAGINYASCKNGTCSFFCVPGQGDCDGMVSNGCESTFQSDPHNCNGCGNDCLAGQHVVDAGCVNWKCNITQCDAGWNDCDPLVPGCETFGSCPCIPEACPVVHNAIKTCLNGQCSGNCSSSYRDCNGDAGQIGGDGCEANIFTDISNCGGCGKNCNGLLNVLNSSCAHGQCSFTCAPGFGNCDSDPSNGCEADFTSPEHCGFCHTNCSNQPNVANATCIAGVCGVETCVEGWSDCFPGRPGCETNEPSCSCIPSQCPVINHGVKDCINGMCSGTCNSPFVDCNNDLTNPNGNGCESNPTTDRFNCGSCGNNCSTLPNIVSSQCNHGSCMFTCAPGWGNCDGIQSNGCETDVTSDPLNCNRCGRNCTNQQHTSDLTCTAGVCGYSACEAGWSDCFAGVPGCETNQDNCNCILSQCPVVAHGSRACINGNCSGICNSPFADCNNDLTSLLSDGCETNLNNSPSNCGTCGYNCSTLPNTVSQTCKGNGTCGFGCAAGFGNCDALPSNGCEADLTSDPLHCGFCKVNCNSKFSVNSSLCIAGTCSIDTCDANWGDCDSNANNGCETNLNLAFSCGSCNNSCFNLPHVAQAVCSNGQCQITTCKFGYSDCSEIIPGCETNAMSCPSCPGVNLLNDTQNCGDCDNDCGQNTVCNNGTCECLSGYESCDGTLTNGCEININNDTSNCGMCGWNCGSLNNVNPSNLTCSAGECVFGCLSSAANCDLVENNGCETNITSIYDCGSCGNDCISGSYFESLPAGSTASCSLTSGCEYNIYS